MTTLVRSSVVGALILLASLNSPAAAEVVRQAPQGFVVRATAEVAATPEQTWTELIAPSRWWNPRHSFSGDAANLSLTPVAGGCFCERLPSANGRDDGGVEHMRVVNVEARRVLRMAGGLGPLQSEAVSGVLTITLKATDKGSRILFEYVVGGYMRYTTDEIAPVVDKVVGEQLSRLALALDPSLADTVAPRKETGAGSREARGHSGPDAVQSSQSKLQQEETGRKIARLPQQKSQLVTVLDAVMQSKGASRALTVEDKVTPQAEGAVAKGGPSYVQRDFEVRLDKRRLWLVPTGQTDDAVPVLARFGREELAAAFRSALGRAKGATVSCRCTGSYVDGENARSFLIIDAELDAASLAPADL